MNSTDAEQSQAIQYELRPTLERIWDALDVGTARAREYFEGINRPIEPSLAGPMARYYAKEHLQDRGHEVERDFEQTDLQNLGLAIFLGRYYIRVWKTCDGAIPFPGSSRAKRLFLTQQPELDLGFTDVSRLKLAVLWTVTKDYRLERLTLACPRFVPYHYGPVAVYWTVSVKHPATTIRPTSESSPDVEDLPIEFEGQEEDEQTGESI